MLLRIEHQTTLSYSEPVSETVFEVRMAPLSDDEQTALGYRLRILPTAPVVAYRDGFGNRVELFNVATPYQQLSIVATSFVRTHRRQGEGRLARLSQGNAATEWPTEVLDYLRPSALVDDSVLLDEFIATLPNRQGSLLELIQGLQDAVHSRLIYEKQVTTSSTRLSEALALGRGVCQDYTHLFIGACRSIGIPARYVSGYIHEPGEVETHAWCQIFAGSAGWVDIDPTHNLFVGDEHVAVAVGRDYEDVTPNRGVWKGNARETIAVTARVEPVDRVPYEWQGWAEPSPWTEPMAPGFAYQSQRLGPGGYQYQMRGGRPSHGGQRSSYRGNYRHQQGQQQQDGPTAADSPLAS